MLNTRLSITTLTFIALLAIAGCGQGESEPGPSSFDNVICPEDFPEFATTFSEVKHTIREGNEVKSFTHYTYEGSETVSGIEADKITISSELTGSDVLVSMWLDDEGNIIQGEEQRFGVIPEDKIDDFRLLDFTVNMMNMFELAKPWVSGNTIAVSEADPSIQIHSMDPVIDPLSDLDAPIYTVQIRNGQDHTMYVADYGDYQVVVGWKISGGAAPFGRLYLVEYIELR